MFSGIILAGGKSSRMGRDKTLIKVHNKTLIEQTLEKVASIVDDVVIASNNTAKYHFENYLEVPDMYPGMGPLAGMHAGLTAVKHDYAFVVSCDMPLFNPELAAHLLKFRQGYDIVVPVVNGRWEPLCAVYAKECLPVIADCLDAGVCQVSKLYSKLKVLKLDESQLKDVGNIQEMLYNMNTPEDVNYLNQESGKRL